VTSASGSEPTRFALLPEERSLWAVRFAGDTLRIGTDGWRRAGGLLCFAAAAGFTAAAIVLPTAGPRLLCVLIGVYLLSFAVLWAFGSIVATPDGITRRWLGVKNIPWDELDYLQVVEEVPPWVLGFQWFEVAVIELSTRDGRTLTLWPTRSSINALTGGGGPNTAQIKRNMLARYREVYAPSVTP